jgi:hypothetical protein
MLTKEQLEAERSVLQQELTQTIANLHAIQGAIQFCEKVLHDLSIPVEAK